jgi:hypothetical protein
MKGQTMYRLSLTVAGLFLTFLLSLAYAGGHKNKAGNGDADKQHRPEATQPQEEHKAKGKPQKRDKSDHDVANDDPKKDAKERSDAKPERGNEQSQEMLERRDERKRIQDDYKEDREPGQEERKTADEPGKKPWYKFWE